MASKTCPQCGNRADEVVRFCGQCGFRFDLAPPMGGAGGGVVRDSAAGAGSAARPSAVSAPAPGAPIQQARTVELAPSQDLIRRARGDSGIGDARTVVPVNPADPGSPSAARSSAPSHPTFGEAQAADPARASRPSEGRLPPAPMRKPHLTMLGVAPMDTPAVVPSPSGSAASSSGAQRAARAAAPSNPAHAAGSGADSSGRSAAAEPARAPSFAGAPRAPSGVDLASSASQRSAAALKGTMLGMNANDVYSRPLQAGPAPIAPSPPTPPTDDSDIADVTTIDVPRDSDGSSASAGQGGHSERMAGPQPRPGSGAMGPPAARTMLGIALPTGAASEADSSARPRDTGPSDPALQPGPAAGAPARNRTMLGIAQPGIAPTGAGNPAAGGPLPSGSAAPGGPAFSARQQTMLGVARPGIAPSQAGGPQAPSGGGTGTLAPDGPFAPRTQMASGPGASAIGIVPMPPPLVDNIRFPAPPRRAQKSGMPVAMVAGGVAVLVLAVGLALFLTWRSAPPLSAQPRFDAKGNEELHLRCEGCPDGTVARLDDGTAKFEHGEADLRLTTPLKVGDNPIVIKLDRPGVGRDEDVKVKVPLAYRILTDMSQVGAAKPAIVVRVEAPPGTQVLVDGAPVTFDAEHRGSVSIDLTAETSGPSTDAKALDKNVPYSATPPNSPAETGTVLARVTVLPLVVDAPGAIFVTDAASIAVAGRTAKGAAVTVNGAPATSAPDGSFELAVDLPPTGSFPIDVRTSLASFATRTARVVVKRVASLDAEAKAFEATAHLGYDAVARDIAGAVGQPIVVEGDVIEARALGHQTVILMNDRRGCAHGPCVTRVVLGREAKIDRGETWRAFGRVSRAVTAGAKTVPEVDAEFMLRARSGK